MHRWCRSRRWTLWRLRLYSRCRCLRGCLSSSGTSWWYTRCRLSYRLYTAERRGPSTRRYSYITRGVSTHLTPWLGTVVSMKLRSIRGDSVLGRHLRLLLLLRWLLLLLWLLLMMMMVMTEVTDVNGELGMRQLIEMGTR